MIRATPRMAIDPRKVATGAVLLALLGICASVSQAALRAIVEQQSRPVRKPAPAAGPPSAQPVELAAPAAGVTGTIALPAVPADVDTRALPFDPTIQPARPFAFGGASALSRGRALECLTTAIYYEAATEPDAGQQAVAQVILNRVRHPAFPSSVCGVVYQGSEHAGCQFSFACDGALARRPSPAYWNRAMKVAALALAGHVFAPVGLATHYHTYAVTPSWNRSLVMTAAIGAHFFHRWKGYWGTLAAFHQAYAGSEPAPGPHARTDLPVAATIPIPAAAPVPPDTKAAPPPVTPTANIQPGYEASGTPTQAAPPPDDPESQILDRWKDSGKPLR